MNESLEILEFRRKLKNRKDEFKNNMSFVSGLFSIDDSDYMKKFEWLGEEMVNTIIEMEKLKLKMNDLDYKCEKLKSDVIVDNNIDVRDKVINLKNRENIIDVLYKSGFMSSDLWEILKTSFWNDRKTQRYELAKWK
tara:strand:- start:4316 stop:4726 length:411 start_codon:yes stop_codon:yes gene_type:complete